MTLSPTVLQWLAPAIMMLGAYVLGRCIGMLRKVISPQTQHRYRVTFHPETVSLPHPGRYAISVVIPPLVLATGTAYFSAMFAVKHKATGRPVPYRSTSRFLFNVKRADMRGHQSHPLGHFQADTAGDYAVVCLNPDTIRPTYQLEVTPYVSPLVMPPMIIGTIASFGMVGGGFIVSILAWTGSI